MGVDFVDVGEVPVAQLAADGIDVEAGFFQHLAPRRFCRRLVQAVLGAGDALPVARMVGALDQQHLQIGRVDDDEDRLGNLEGLGRLHAGQHSAGRLAGA